LGDEAIEELSELVGTSTSEAIGRAKTEIGKRLDELYDAEGKALLEKFNRGKKSIAEFKAQLSKVLKSFTSKHRMPLFVLVDELDRCRPTYAVTLLERVKHLFDVDDVVFVLATDTSQLRHSIKAIYGSDFDAGRYLHRFFDQTYRFQAPSVRDFVAKQFSKIDQKKLSSTTNLTPAEFAADAFVAFQLNLRDIQQCVDVLSNCITVWNKPCPVVLIVLIPLIVAQQQRIEPNFSASFGGALANVLCHSGFSSDWKIDFNIWENREKKFVGGWQLFERIVSVVKNDNLPNITNPDHGKPSAEERIITGILREELMLRFPQGYQTNNPPVSLIRGYPDLVRSVGRLAPT
jgi:KAP-like P-loop domain-containing protein